MTAQVLTTNLNADEIGFSFLGVAGASATGMRSPIGNFTWTATTLTSAGTSWVGLAYGDGFAVALNSNGLSNISLDNATTAWLSNGSIPSGSAWGQLAYGNGYFVSVCSGTTTSARMSIINQVVWETKTLPSSTTWSYCAFGGGNFVAVAASGTAAAYSTDNGNTWNAVTLPVSATWSDVKYFNGKFILVATGVNYILTSTDGTAWTQSGAILPSSATWSTLAYITGGTNGTWVITATSGTQAAYSTDNGVSWNASVVPSANWRAITGGRSSLRGQQLFIAAPQSSTAGIFSFDGITWYSFTCTSGTWTRLIWAPTVWKTGVDTLTISDSAVMTVNTNQQRGWNAITVANGTINITNTSTTTPITFATVRANATAALQSITPSSGLGKINVVGNFIEIGTSNGTANQQFTSPYSRGDYIPALWVETGNGTGVFEIWVNVTGYQSYQQYSPMRNGINGVGNGDGGTCFTQLEDATKARYVVLTGVSLVANSCVVKCADTSKLNPGYKIVITGAGPVTLDTNAIVESIIDSTTFTTSVVATGTAGTKYTSLEGIAIPGIYDQYAPTVQFGDDVHGKIPPNGAKIKVPNILITDYTSAALRNTGWSGTDLPCYFVGTNAGNFEYNTCLFGESYANYTQAATAKFTNVGFCYVPYVSECYALSFTNVGFGAPPVITYLGVATALGATGSCTATSADVTIPSSTAIRPGVLITGTGIRPSTVSTVVSNTLLTMSQPAHTTSSNIAYTYYGNRIERDYRFTQSTTPASLSTFTACQYAYVSGAVFDNVVFAYGGHPYAGAGAGAVQANTCISTQYSNNIQLTNVKIIRLGISQRNRTQEAAIGSVTAGDNITVTGLQAYNLNLATFLNATNVVLTSPKSRNGIFNEGYNFANTNRSYFNPVTGTALTADTKYWFKTRSYYTHNMADTTAAIDGFTVCAAFKGVNENDHAPRIFGVTPFASAIASPTVAYGNGVWVAIFGTQSISATSSDNGATWTMGILPHNNGVPWWKIIFVGGSINMFYTFTAAQTGTVTAAGIAVASSSDGLHWTKNLTSPSTVWFRALAFDNTIATNKFILLGGTNTTTVGTTANYSTNGFSWTTGGTGLASASWQAAASNGAGRIVAISGGGTASTASAYTTNGNTWTAGGALASSLWQDIAYGSSKFVAISGSATNGPTAYSTDGTSWTASTAPTLPAGYGLWQKIVWTGTVFVILSGCLETTYATAVAANFSRYFATSTDGITWSALKILPENTSWIGMANNGNAVLLISTITSRVAYTADISTATPTWTIYTNNFAGLNLTVRWENMVPSFTTASSTLAAMATTAGSTNVTCTSTARLQPGVILSQPGFPTTAGVMPGTGLTGITSGVIVSSITNATTFVTAQPALYTMSGQTPSWFRHVWQLFRSTTEGFTPSASNLITSTTTAANVAYQDSDVVPGTTYYYRLRKPGKDATVATCSGTAGQATVTTTARFDRAITTTLAEGISGTNVLKFLATPGTSDAWALGIMIGMPVSGTGIPANTVVTDIPDYNQVVLNNNLTGDIVQISSTVYFGVFAGMVVFGAGVGSEATILSVDSTTQITLNVNNVSTFASVSLQFYTYWTSPEVAGIAQFPVVVQNNLLQSATFSTSPWVNTNCTVTNAALTAPVDLLFGGTVTLTAASVLVTAANATQVQTVTLGASQSYTFSVYVRAATPSCLSSLNTVTLTVNATSQTFDVPNNWTRLSVTGTSTATGDTVISLTWPKRGTLAYVARGTLTIGNSLPVPYPVTTTTALAVQPQTLPSGIGLLGWNFEENGSGIELTYTAAAGIFWYHIHQSTTPGFTPTDSNQIYSNEATGTDAILYAAAASSNILLDTYLPVSTASPCHAYPVYMLGGTTNVRVKDSIFNFNGTAAVPFIDNPAYNLYIHNTEFNKMRSYAAAVYGDYATTYNSSTGVRLQNCRSDRSRIPWASQILNAQYKGVFGARNGRVTGGTAWNFATQPTVDGFPIASQAVYDCMFKEMTFGDTGKGCLHLMMVGSTKAVKPYTLSGSAYIDNSGRLYLQAVGDSAIIEWPHIIKGVTGFDNLIPLVHAVDLCSASNVNYGIVALIEYDLDKGSGYSGSWTRLTNRPDLISAETGINAATGFRIKLRITARRGVKYTGRSTTFVVGETLQNATSNPTATMVLDEVLEEGAGIGTLIVSNVTGTWTTANTIYSGATTRSTIVATNNDVFMPAATSYIAAIRIFTTTDTTKKYSYVTPTLTLTGLQPGTDIVILTAGTTTVLTAVDSNPGTTYTYVADSSGTFDIGILKQGYVPLYIRNYTLTTDASIPIAQMADRNYV